MEGYQYSWILRPAPEIQSIWLGGHRPKINLGADTASASAGLNAPDLIFVGSEGAIIMGSDATIVEYALTAGSGIETIANFTFGQDFAEYRPARRRCQLAQAYDTKVEGTHAIAIASTTDLAHGVVLLGMSTGQTAANLLVSHTTFSGGHDLIS